MNLTLSVLPGRYAICRLGGGEASPLGRPFRPPAAMPAAETSSRSPGRKMNSRSFVRRPRVPEAVRCDRGWRCLKVAGPLDLSMTGVLAALASPLAEAEINIFAVSTFDTDYLLVKDGRLSVAVRTLIRAGHRIEPG